MSTNPGPQGANPGARPAAPVARQLPAAGASPPAAPPAEAAADDVQQAIQSHFLLFNAVPSWAVSGVVHFFLLLAMALMPITQPKPNTMTQVVSAPVEEKVEEVEDIKQENMPLNLNTTAVSTDATAQSNEILSTVTESDSQTPSPYMDADAAPLAVELTDVSDQVAPKNDLAKTVGTFTGTGADGRGEAMKGKLVAAAGGSKESEAAVARALEWFARHQLPDGGWNFDHRLGQCNGRCSDAGRMSDCRTGATAMALLPFLGAGQTHKQGKYKDVVGKGLYFLIGEMKMKDGAGDLAQGGGSMYSHGLASIVLCEAYAMTHDRGLMTPAQASLNHIMYAQDPVGGGWRYAPRMPGDTSAVGWQLMALKSGHMAYLSVDPRTIQGAIKFLDSVQVESGAGYGYTDPGKGPATTAVGLLCRMYLGWKKDHPGIQRGVEFLSASGPSKGNMYYNYYATQVMRHYEGEKWDKWNVEMRDWLVGSQEKDEKSHLSGSWSMKGDHGSDAGGRIYCTSMATMILEVYYRHMPIYAKQASEDEFPLEAKPVGKK